MSICKLLTIFFLLFSAKSYSQKKYIEKYESGKIKIEGYLKENTLDSIYTEFYENGNLKTEGFYKNCEYKTNKRGIKMGSCGGTSVSGVPSNIILDGKRHGQWKDYFENGILRDISNFYCDILQGNFYSYNEDGKLETIQFYNEGDLKYEQEYNEKGIVIKNIEIKKIFKNKENVRIVHTLEFYDNGDLKSENNLEDYNKKYIETSKEFYPNGFAKLEKYTINDKKNGIYREYFENGNVKYEGAFENDIPIKKQYYYKENGSPMKMEIWKNGKIFKTETE